MTLTTAFPGVSMPLGALLTKAIPRTPRAKLLAFLNQRGVQPFTLASVKEYKNAMLAADRALRRLPQWITVEYAALPDYRTSYGFPATPMHLSTLVGDVEKELGRDVRTRCEVYDGDPLLFFEVKNRLGMWHTERIYAGVWGEDPRFSHLLQHRTEVKRPS